MAGETIYATRYAKHPTDSLAGITHAEVRPGATTITDPGAAGTPGQAGSLVTDSQLSVTLYGTDYAALLALVGATAANLVLGAEGAAGANEKHTAKSVYFNAVPGMVAIPPKDAGGNVGRFSISGDCDWGAEDTFATMFVAAADT